MSRRDRKVSPARLCSRRPPTRPNDDSDVPYCAANTKGTCAVVVPLERGKRQVLTLLSMQRARLGYPFGSPLVVTESTLPEGEIVMVALTRADVGASADRELNAVSQHPRRTPGM